MVLIRLIKKFILEATPGIEPGNESFAGSCLTAWRCRHFLEVARKHIFYSTLLKKAFWALCLHKAYSVITIVKILNGAQDRT